MAARVNRAEPPTYSMCELVTTSRRTGSPNASTASAKGSYCDGTISVSITVTPSSSTTAPALGWPGPGSSSSQAWTPAASSTSSPLNLPAPGDFVAGPLGPPLRSQVDQQVLAHVA